MARNIPFGVPEYCYPSVSIGDTGTICQWVKTGWNSGSGVQQFIFDTDTSGDEPSFQDFSDNNIYAGFAKGGNTRVVIADTGLFTSGTWAHWAITWSVAAGQTLYKNAVSKGTSGYSSFSHASATHLVFGNGGGAPGAALHSLNGDLAEFGYWNAILSAGELAALTAGYSPAMIRPGNLVGYWPLIGRTSPEIELIGGNGAALTGTSAASHPRIIMPRKAKTPWIPAETVSI